jgi:hypothetical protein
MYLRRSSLKANLIQITYRAPATSFKEESSSVKIPIESIGTGRWGFFVLLGISSIIAHIFPEADHRLHLIVGNGSFTARHRARP